MRAYRTYFHAGVSVPLTRRWAAVVCAVVREMRKGIMDRVMVVRRTMVLVRKYLYGY